MTIAGSLTIILLAGVAVVYVINYRGFKDHINSIFDSIFLKTYTEPACNKTTNFAYTGAPNEAITVKVIMLGGQAACEVNRIKKINFVKIGECPSAAFQTFMSTDVQAEAMNLTFDQIYNKKQPAMDAAKRLATKYISVCSF